MASGKVGRHRVSLIKSFSSTSGSETIYGNEFDYLLICGYVSSNPFEVQETCIYRKEQGTYSHMLYNNGGNRHITIKVTPGSNDDYVITCTGRTQTINARVFAIRDM